jgi:NitT/TauT family transport system substrate-binding protein
MAIVQTRRRFLTTLSAVSAAGLVGAPRALAAEGPLETTAVRLAKTDGLCIAPQYVADELLHAEGFTDVRYVDVPETTTRVEAIARGALDFSANFAAPLIVAVAAGEPITFLAGVHVGCFELFGNDSIRSIADLKGKSVGVPGLGSNQHVFLTAMAAHVGLDPNKDIHWVTSQSPKPRELFIAGRIDAFLGFPPEPQELRARNVGHVIFNSALDRPWSQYFCCMLAGHRDYVRRHPGATKRVLRAVLKAADLCASQPEQVAQRIVSAGFTPRYEYALQTLRDISYGRWRDYEPEDTVRFYSLRLREVGMIRATPNKILADGTDWRFWNELKRELKH